MGCTAACQGEGSILERQGRLFHLGLPVAPAGIAHSPGAGFAVSVFGEELPSCAPSETCCRQAPSQMFAAGAVHTAVSTLLHAVGLRGQTGVIPNCKGVHVAHREPEVKISKIGTFWGLSGA